MAITYIKSEDFPLVHGREIIFREMELAKIWCTRTGIEIGAAAHNPFGLEGSKNVALYSDDVNSYEYRDYYFFRRAQISMCGAYAAIDEVGTANELPFDNIALNYVLSSHVIEHVPNPIGAFIEWNRVLRPSGVVFIIFPKRDALPSDRGRNLTKMAEFVSAFEKNAGLFDRENGDGHIGGHYNVFSLASMKALIKKAMSLGRFKWQLMAEEETDSKVGNGHTVVYQKI